MWQTVNILSYIKILRPTQWLKNLMLFFPPFLGGVILQPGMIEKGMVPFTSFCLASSATYIFNDILDRENDLFHPHKKQRPIPSGIIPLTAACLFSATLFALSLFAASYLSVKFLLFLLAYLAISFLYSLKLKQIPVVDLFCISAGFLLRLQAGGEAFGVVVSAWLFLSVLLLSIFLSAGKRLSELKTLGEHAGSHRKSLLWYPNGFLDVIMYMTGAAVLVTYTLYTVSRASLVYTVPLSCFGIIRYLYRVKTGMGGDPTESLLKDVPLFMVGLLWVFMVGWSIYK